MAQLSPTARAFNEARALIVEWVTSRPFMLYTGDIYQYRVHLWLKRNPAITVEPEDEHLRGVELSLAYEQATYNIEHACDNPDDPANPGEYLETVYDLSTSAVDLSEEVAYLDSRRLLHREYPDHPSWVTICDETEPLPAEQAGA